MSDHQASLLVGRDGLPAVAVTATALGSPEDQDELAAIVATLNEHHEVLEP